MSDSFSSTTDSGWSPGGSAVVVPSGYVPDESGEPIRSNWMEPTVEERLFEEGYAFDFFQAIWLLERLYPDRRPVGRQGAPHSEVVRFRARQSLNFPPSAIFEIDPANDSERPPLVTVAFMGLTGPSGALPRHYTELLMRLEREAKGHYKHALRDWFDLFNHRIISLFFRSWEKYRFYVAYSRGEYARPEPDTFTSALYSLVGLGNPTLRGRLKVSAWRDPRRRQHEHALAKINDLSLLYYGGLLSQRPRSAANLQSVLSDYFGVPVLVQQFQGQWLLLDAANQSKLSPEGGNCRLGVDAVLGERVWDLQSKIRVRLGPLTYGQFLEFLPDPAPVPARKACFLLARLVRLFVGPDIDFDVQLVLRSDDVPACQLDGEATVGPRLGWNTWLGTHDEARDPDDAVFVSGEIPEQPLG